MSKRVVFILGMHRSGTSCLTGCLEECGLPLGDVNRSAPHNKKGNRENVRVMELHDDLLRFSGGSWDNPPERVVWTDRHRRWRDRILSEYDDLQVFGIKDPRTLFVLDGWLETGIDACFAGTFRHPLAVVESLRVRNQFPASRSLDIWMMYNRKMVALAQERETLLISFDLPGDEYLTRVLEIASGLGLEPPSDAWNFEFFDPQLRRSKRTARERLPADVRQLYERLVGFPAKVSAQ